MISSPRRSFGLMFLALVLVSNACMPEPSPLILRGAPTVIITDLRYFSDDSVALLALLRSRTFSVEGIITTAGNVSARQAHVDAERLLREQGISGIPVVQGPSMTALSERRRRYEQEERPRWSAPAYVGAFGEPLQPGDEDTSRDNEAADFLVAQAASHPQALNIVLLAPATVIAQAIARAPDVMRNNVRSIVALGGAFAATGNVTASAEFNVWFDPEAMSTVLSATDPVFIPLDSLEHAAYPRTALVSAHSDTPATRHMRGYLRQRQAQDLPMWDEALAALLIDPSLIHETRQTHAAIVTAAGPDYGRTIETGGGSRIAIVTRIDAGRIYWLIERALAN